MSLKNEGQDRKVLKKSGIEACFFCLWIQFSLSVQEKQTVFGNIFINIDNFLMFFVIMRFFVESAEFSC